MKPNKFTIVLHIHRTAGNTLDRILQKKFGNSLLKRQLKKIQFNQSGELSLEDSLKHKRFSDKYFTSHVCYGIHELLPQPSTYISFVRDPVSRIISLYYYSKLTPIAFYHGLACKKSLEDFALNTTLHELDNGQVRIIAGGSKDYFMNRTPYGKCDQSLLETAKDNIHKHFTLVGVTDLFDESLFLLCNAYSWRMPYYFRLNQSSGDKPIISQEIRDKIAEKNYLDLELYRYCKQQLLEKLQTIPQSKQELEQYRKNNQRFNQIFGQLYGAYNTAKSIVRNKIIRY